jgi:predicted SnoaL-like aldol condensation-catalyzing enzyme
MIRSMPTISDRNKARVQFFVEAVWNEGRLELIDDLVAADYMEHLSCPNMAVLGPDGVRRLVSSHRSVHPDLYVKIDDDIAEHDLVAVRWRATGDGQGHATPEPAPDCSGISVVRLLAGKLVDSYTTVRPTASGVAV